MYGLYMDYIKDNDGLINLCKVNQISSKTLDENNNNIISTQNYIILLFIFMLIGGCTGSTTGGIKIFRIQILFKVIIQQIQKIIRPCHFQ